MNYRGHFVEKGSRSRSSFPRIRNTDTYYKLHSEHKIMHPPLRRGSSLLLLGWIHLRLLDRTVPLRPGTPVLYSGHMYTLLQGHIVSYPPVLYSALQWTHVHFIIRSNSSPPCTLVLYSGYMYTMYYRNASWIQKTIWLGFPLFH